MKNTILVVDDERSIRYSLRRTLEEKGIKVLEAKKGEEAIDIIQREEIDLVLMDVRMAGMSGLDTLQKIKKINPKMLVIMMTAFGTTKTAIEAMKFGAFDYVLKPFDIPKMWDLVEKALHTNQLMKSNISFERKAEEIDIGTEYIIGNSSKMQEVYKLVGQVAEKDVTVLLRGESGTGKELIARAIYQHSKRNNQPFLAINCAAIPEALLESELFGYEKGAFTDAQVRRIGKFEQCNGGTIFLDEIGDMAVATQAKILRVLQEKEITRLGGNETIKVDVRLIVATNTDLEKAIEKSKFRKDLYYRLNVVTINLPVLKNRKKDIPLLSRYFLKKFNSELGKDIVDINPKTMKTLTDYSWPGNVRELENVIKRACVLCKGIHILPGELSLDLGKSNIMGLKEEKSEKGLDKLLDELYSEILNTPGEYREEIMVIIEKGLIIRALKEAKGNQSKTAQILGINRNTLRNKIEKYKIKIDKDVKI